MYDMKLFGYSKTSLNRPLIAVNLFGQFTEFLKIQKKTRYFYFRLYETLFSIGKGRSVEVVSMGGFTVLMFITKLVDRTSKRNYFRILIMFIVG